MAITSSSSELESRPGQTLADHLINTARLCFAMASKRLSFGNAKVNQAIAATAWRIGYTHDLGKATRYFQEYLHTKEDQKASLKNNPKTRHSLLSSLFTYHIVSDYLAHQQLTDHEICRYLPLLSLIAVKRHHGNPGDFNDELLSFKPVNDQIEMIKSQLASIHGHQFDDLLAHCPLSSLTLAEFTASIDDLINKVILRQEKIKWRKYRKQGDLDIYLLFQLLFSTLIAADKQDAIGTVPEIESVLIEDDLVDRYRRIKFTQQDSAHPMNLIRNRIYDTATATLNRADMGSKIFALNVPTGTGKTLTGLSLALKLRERIQEREGFTPKIVYCLPFLSIIEQNFNVFEDIFKVVTGQSPHSGQLLKHHSMAEIVYRNQDNTELPVKESQFLIQAWSSEIVVTTFMQLFHTMVSNKNRMIIKFNAIVNAIVILDEIQTIPYKYWHLARTLFNRMAARFNTRFILMTATQPLIFKDNEMTELISQSEKKRCFESLNRIQFINQSANELALDEFVHILENDIWKYADENFLIVLNTINSSIEIFRRIKSFVRQNDIPAELFYLSTNIIPKHRLERIERIKKSNKRKIIVSTQLVEAGVDIDVDRVYRDFAPFDSLNQVAGRCNRNFSDTKKGTVVVFTLKGENDLFYRYIYAKGDLSIIKTKDILADQNEMTENEFLQAGLNYFSKLKDAKADDEAEYLLTEMSRLNFEKVCENKKHKFQLIESDYPTQDVFMEIDARASQTWRKYMDACQLEDPFERKNAMNVLKNEFYNYVISVPASKAPGEESLDAAVVYINQAQIKSTYKIDTGFIREEQIQYIL